MNEAIKAQETLQNKVDEIAKSIDMISKAVTNLRSSLFGVENHPCEPECSGPVTLEQKLNWVIVELRTNCNELSQILSRIG